jgi:site-specific DNA-adenine methylase
MKPFFCYYGGKNRVGRSYPRPVNNIIIEPFAGCAGYSVSWNATHVHLSDLDERVCGVWEYLIASSARDILALPDRVDHVDDIHACQEAKWLIGWWLNKGCAYPMKQPSTWMKQYTAPNSWWGPAIKARLAEQVINIKHWTIKKCCYTEVDNKQATWFVDPPYNNKAGKYYKHNDIDYPTLAEWCKQRQGQVIVCENAGADWLPFKSFKDIKSSGRRKDGVKVSKEVMWTK